MESYEGKRIDENALQGRAAPYSSTEHVAALAGVTNSSPAGTFSASTTCLYATTQNMNVVDNLLNFNLPWVGPFLELIQISDIVIFHSFLS